MKNFASRNLLTIATLAVLCACGSPPRREPIIYNPPTQIPQPTPLPKPAMPPGFSIGVNIENFVIVNHKILDTPLGLGKVRFAGKWRYLDGKILYKFKSESFPNHYWMASIPENANNQYMELRAKPRIESESEGLTQILPPKNFSLQVIVRNGKIENHVIVDPDPSWGKFTFTSFDKAVATFINIGYPDCKWLGKFPNYDGKTLVTMVLASNDCGK